MVVNDICMTHSTIYVHEIYFNVNNKTIKKDKFLVQNLVCCVMQSELNLGKHKNPVLQINTCIPHL